MKRWVLPLALATTLIYLALSVSAAACVFSHQNPSRATHHHTGGVVHASLCVWACHANPTVDLPSLAPQAETLRVMAWLVLVATGLSSLVSRRSAQSRAPPYR